jgi:hypothetical protein
MAVVVALLNTVGGLIPLKAKSHPVDGKLYQDDRTHRRAIEPLRFEQDGISLAVGPVVMRDDAVDRALLRDVRRP